MYISRVYIKNYRNFDEFDLFIPDGEPLTIIGGNNSGKTNFLQAIRLVLDSNIPPWEKKLNEEDFYWHNGDSPSKDGEEIVITITFSDVSDKKEIGALLYSLTPSENTIEGGGDHMEANISFVFSPTIHNKGSEYDVHDDYNGFLVAGRYHPSGYYYSNTGEVKEYDEKILELHACKRKEDFYKYFYLSEEDIEKIREGGDEPFDKRITKQLHVNKIRRHVNLLFLDAIRDVKNDFYQGYNSLVSQLLRSAIQNTNSNTITSEITDAFKGLRAGTSMPQTISIIDDIESRLQNDKSNFLTDKAGITIGTPKINLENIGRYFNFLVSLNEDLKENLEMNIIGLGYQNLAYISAIFSLFELKKEIFLNDSNDKVQIMYNLLLIEEPEAHLDVQNQKFLHTQIEKKTEKLAAPLPTDETEEADETEEEAPQFYAFTQVIQTSHSTHLASKSDLKNIVVMQKNVKKTRVLNIDNILKADQETYVHKRKILKQYLDATRSALLFARKVILVEGLSEKYALGSILNFYLKKNKPRQNNIDIDSEGVEIVEVGGKNFSPFTSLYKPEGLNNKCLSLQDGDSQLQADINNTEYQNVYTQNNPTTENNDSRLVKKNVFTFEIDSFFLPNPEDKESNNVAYLKLILFKFMKDGDYFKTDNAFQTRITAIDNFETAIKTGVISNENIKSFFETILSHEVSKPTLSLYLSSLLKAKLLNDPVEIEAWKNGYEPEEGLNITKFDDLGEFVMPKYIEEGLTWLITDQN